MICNICKQNEATVHLTEIVNDQVTELHLCETCAQQKSMQMEQQFGLSDLLAGLVDFGKQSAQAEKLTAECQNCHMTYADFKKIGRLGCSECYRYFSKYLGGLLRRIHGSAQHVGKLPASSLEVSSKRPESYVTELKEKLRKAISDEEFEEAARLRDKIRQLENQTKGKSEKQGD